MIYILAAIGAITVAVLLWRAFGPENDGGSRQHTIAPDDDPDFLRRLGEQRPKQPGDEGQ